MGIEAEATTPRTVQLDDLGLTPGRTYPMAIFHAERQGLNEAISDLTSLDLQANLGNRGGATSTEVELRIARDISIGFSHILGITSPSTGPDRNFATVQWRFTHKWALEATVGDAGSAALDLLWRHRYR